MTTRRQKAELLGGGEGPATHVYKGRGGQLRREGVRLKCCDMYISKYDETYHFVCQITPNWSKHRASVCVLLGHKWEIKTQGTSRAMGKKDCKNQ